ncbi:helix-turn-helix domain-containing protein [Dietzia sp. ANT_WB102]|uniref:helix-turn-helix domain-containing protein n=1 Tax=Dietzia sp. ANT_WB102 TaxID=2597345 RepID=UPI0011ED9732|nr:helix-turn-helix domain-containing protein [Dietzia sp. ANT_WB102]KAA0916428.1 bacteriophage CI repressor [Dietzia sp. ANT_WB102]
MTHSIQPNGVPELTLGWRIQMAIDAAGLKQTDLMDYFELSRGTISRWCRDDGVPPKRHQIMQIALMTGVNATWLETGKTPTGGGGGEENTDYGLKVRSSTN